MALAAPVLCILAGRMRSDRWTIGYLSSWVTYAAAAYLAIWIF